MKILKKDVENALLEGYKNSQELIRFMDAKVGVIIGVCSMIFVHSSEHFFSKSYIFSSPIPLYYIGKILLCSGVIISGILTVINVFRCIKAHGGHKQSLHPKIIFPVGNITDFYLFKKSIENIDENHVYNELVTQVFNVGIILDIKIKNCNVSLICIAVQITFWLTMIILPF